MKKLFSKIEKNIDNTAKETNTVIGKVFTLSRQTVTVEDVLAEGKYFLKRGWICGLKCHLMS